MNDQRKVQVTQEAPKTELQKIRNAVEMRIKGLRDSSQILSLHNLNLDHYGYEPRIDELESFLQYLKTEHERMNEK